MSKFPVMLASPNKMIDRIYYPCIVQTKMDGMRALIVTKGNNIEVYSRNGKVMAGLGEHFKPMVNHNNTIYDGELTVLDNKDKPLDRKTGNGILHKAVVGTISSEEIKRIRITLWDIIPYDDWKIGFSATPYHTRLSELQSIPESNLHTIVKTQIANSFEEAKAMFKEAISNKEEGIILKNDEHPWEAKRSLQIVKMKNEFEIDLKVIGWTVGTGKYKGLMGNLQCENKDGSIKVEVGTGYDDEQRKKFTREFSVGKIITVKYNEIITRKDKDVKTRYGCVRLMTFNDELLAGAILKIDQLLKDFYIREEFHDKLKQERDELYQR